MLFTISYFCPLVVIKDFCSSARKCSFEKKETLNGGKSSKLKISRKDDVIACFMTITLNFVTVSHALMDVEIRSF